MPKNLSPGRAGGSACRTAHGEGRAGGSPRSLWELKCLSLTCTDEYGQPRLFCALLLLHPV